MEQNKEKAVNLTWTWYLLLTAIVLIMAGIAIAWGLRGSGVVYKNPSLVLYNLAVMICSVIALFLLVLFYYFDSKDMKLIRTHIPKKYITMYFVAGMLLAFTIVVSIIYFTFTQRIIISLIDDKKWDTTDAVNLAYGLGFGIVGLFGLISVGVYRYARLKMDLALMLRRRGENTNTPTESSSANSIESSPNQETSTVSSGLTDNATK